MVSEPTIRFAQLQDVPTVLSFIETGAAEQSPGARVEATEAALVKTLHLNQTSSGSETDSAPRFAWALLIATPNGTTAGLAIYFYNYSTWRAAPGVCLEELFVLPEYRSKGYGKLLIEAVAKEAARAGLKAFSASDLLTPEVRGDIVRAGDEDEATTGYTYLFLSQLNGPEVF
ncbi:hypothetical protein GQX73_g6522 [Xylaria multiplex]|uniref:N-acetyltransferase domain-containing protein n=1 Tax=Xylaria multiplex TaxID=323545 RepID=A0A7C8IQC4_9PEZI|nr:hypothetical protein GQX73_g6522 [Xylaria multiplex]